jgi:hypothetical protein
MKAGLAGRALALCGVVTSALSVAACAKKGGAPNPEAARCHPAPRLTAYRAAAPIAVNGHLDEADWLRAASSGPFTLADGGFTSPYSELRALWTDEALVLGLYAADEDFRAEDGFTVALETADGSPRRFFLSAKGSLSCGAGSEGSCTVPKAITAATDTDGTFDAPGDDDEEWLAELAVPWSALGFSAAPPLVRLDVSRTDAPKRASPRTTSWAKPCGGEIPWGTVEFVRQGLPAR